MKDIEAINRPILSGRHVHLYNHEVPEDEEGPDDLKEFSLVRDICILDEKMNRILQSNDSKIKLKRYSY